MRRRVLFLLPHLEHGGAERVATVLLRNLPRERWEPHLALVARRGELLGDLPDDVEAFDLGAGRVRHALDPIVRHVRELEPHLVYSTLGYLSLALLWVRRRLPPHTRIVIREPTLLSQEVSRKRLPFAWRLAYRHLYPRADTIVCPARSTLEDLARSFGVPRERMRRIPNPIEVERIRALASAGARRHIHFPGARGWDRSAQ